MKWFEGNIPDAIKTSKSKGSLFIVYINGEDEMSKEMDTSWESEEVNSVTDVVALKISITSDDCKHFAQIYPVVVVPSTFCIGENGVPLEVIGGPLKPADLVSRIQQVQQMHAAQKQSLASQSTTGTSQQTTGTAPSTNVAPPSSPTQESSTSGAEQSGDTTQESAAENPLASGDQASAKPLEEKVERAKELIEKRKAEKAQKEFEKGREEEIKRRKFGQDLQKLKQNQQEMQMKELKDQMKKDREEEKKAKEKIRQQIARDREERQARYEKEKREREEAQEEKKREKLLQQQAEAAAEEARKSETARIQVRLPDGSSVTQSFPSSEPLRALQSFVSERLGSSVSLSQAYPKRRFTEEDMSKTFADLQLSPSAVVLAMPGRRSVSQATSSSSSSAVQSGGFLSFFFAPFLLIWKFLYTLLFGGRNNQSGATQSTSQPAETTQTSLRRDRPTTAYQRRSAGPSRAGNMHRLADIRDDDDDMSTYNGNSTQQL